LDKARKVKKKNGAPNDGFAHFLLEKKSERKLLGTLGERVYSITARK